MPPLHANRLPPLSTCRRRWLPTIGAAALAVVVLAAGLLPGGQQSLASGATDRTQPEARPSPRSVVYLPLIMNSNVCAPIPGAHYEAIAVNPPRSDRPAEAHADLNLALRGYAPTTSDLRLVDYGGSGDPGAPQLPWLFADRRTPTIQSVFKVYDWSWTCNCRGAPIAWPPVTMARLATSPGEVISLPDSGYQIGSGFEALVLYAGPERLTLKYTRDDNVVHGYTLHIEGLCVEPALLSLYQSRNASGRTALPALRAGQAVGRARDMAIGVSIRDSGTFMDPRSRKDWWQGR
jgi:hypothetical protein